MSTLARIADRVINRPLLLMPEKAAVIVGVLSGRIGVDAPEASRFEGERTPQRNEDGSVKRDIFGYAEPEPFRIANGVAIVSVVGSLVNRGAWIGASSGLTSYEGVQHQLKRAAAHADVESVILDIHSPGGEAIGAFETAGLVREVAKTKPVIAVVNGMAASAAYAVAAGATEIVTTETGLSGSIGVLILHVDYSRQLQNDGIAPTLIYAGAHKVDGNPFEPLKEEVRSDIQAEVDTFYDLFLTNVASGRGSRLNADAARATEARTFIGQAAVDAGLADRVGTFETVLQDLSRAAGRTTSHVKGKRMSENNGAPAAETTAGITQAQLDAAVTNAKAEAKKEFDASMSAEKARIAGLDKLVGKVAGNADALKIISEAKAGDASVEATAMKLIDIDAFGHAAVITGLQQDSATAAGATPAAAGEGEGTPQTEDGWKAEWQGSQTLQAEYPKVQHYVNLKKHEARKARQS